MVGVSFLSKQPQGLGKNVFQHVRIPTSYRGIWGLFEGGMRVPSTASTRDILRNTNVSKEDVGHTWCCNVMLVETIQDKLPRLKRYGSLAQLATLLPSTTSQPSGPGILGGVPLPLRIDFPSFNIANPKP